MHATPWTGCSALKKPKEDHRIDIMDSLEQGFWQRCASGMEAQGYSHCRQIKTGRPNEPLHPGFGASRE